MRPKTALELFLRLLDERPDANPDSLYEEAITAIEHGWQTEGASKGLSAEAIRASEGRQVIN